MLACRPKGIWHDKQNEEEGRKSGFRMQLGIAGSCRAAEAIRLITKKEYKSVPCDQRAACRHAGPWAALIITTWRFHEKEKKNTNQNGKPD